MLCIWCRNDVSGFITKKNEQTCSRPVCQNPAGTQGWKQDQSAAQGAKTMTHTHRHTQMQGNPRCDQSQLWQTITWLPMSTGSAHLYQTTHPSSAGEVQHCFPTELEPAQASAKEAGNKHIISATLPLHCLPTWVVNWFRRNWQEQTQMLGTLLKVPHLTLIGPDQTYT